VFASTVRGWTSQTGAFDLLSIPGYNLGLGLSPTRVAGIMGEGVASADGIFEFFEKGSLWWAPTTGSTLYTSPALPFPIVASNLVATWGDFMAVQVAFEPNASGRNEWFLLLARLTDWEMRILERAQKSRVRDGAFAFDSRFLYLVPGEVADGDGYLSSFVYRYDLAAFDSIGVPLEASP